MRSPLTQYERQCLDNLLPQSAYDYDPERLRFELEQMLEVLIAKREALAVTAGQSADRFKVAQCAPWCTADSHDEECRYDQFDLQDTRSDKPR